MPVERFSPPRGRPRKFRGPSRSLALTLPNDVIDALHAVDPDLSRAIVRLVQTSVPGALRPAAEITKYGKHAVINVPSTRALETQIGVELVPLPDGRALVSFDDGLSIAELELRIGDVLAERGVEGEARPTFEALAEILRHARRSDTVAVHLRRIIVLEYRGVQSAQGSEGLTSDGG